MCDVCPKCRGTGEVAEVTDWFSAVFTFGLTALVEKSWPVKCKVCRGLGRIK